MSEDKIKEIRDRHAQSDNNFIEYESTWDIHADRATLLAEVERHRAENERLRAEIERLTRERNEARAEYARLCDDIERIENDAWHDGAKHGTSH